MTTRRTHSAVLSALVSTLLLAAALVVATGPVAHARPGSGEAVAAAAKPKTVYFDLMYQPHVKPKRIFLTANSGPYLKKLSWKNWGDKRTKGTGLIISDCASCPPPEKRDAWVTMSKRVYCEHEDVRTYKKIVLRVSEPAEGSDRTQIRLPGGCPPADH